MFNFEKLGDKMFDQSFIEVAVNKFAKRHPGFKDLDFKIVAIENGTASMRLPYNRKFVGDLSTGSLHGGVITTLLDTVCGLCVMTKVRKFAPIATIDLRVDYLRPTKPDVDVIAEVECYHLTKSVAFLRGYAYLDDEDQEKVAHVTGSFMLNTKGPSFTPASRFSRLLGGGSSKP
ncbi:MAG: PaaI family thioesterase [Pseudomonadales bacterium]|nr:PaaI family thioesterase [Pseudomonadales bacterium]